jgi:hypothetical protein
LEQRATTGTASSDIGSADEPMTTYYDKAKMLAAIFFFLLFLLAGFIAIEGKLPNVLPGGLRG